MIYFTDNTPKNKKRISEQLYLAHLCDVIIIHCKDWNETGNFHGMR